MANSPPNHLISSSWQFTDDLLIDAAQRFGTPLYVYDARAIRTHWNELAGALPNAVQLCYSVKANPCLAIVELLAGLGARFEVASLGELLTVRAAEALGTRMIFVGPGKTEIELRRAIGEGIGVIAVESAREVRLVDELARRARRSVPVALRINPGRTRPPRGGRFRAQLSMAGATQFGMSKAEGAEVLAAFPMQRQTGASVIGVHAYLGTRILDWQLIVENTRIILETAARLQASTGHRFEFIDIGGGFGVACYDNEDELDLEAMRINLDEVIDTYLRDHPWTRTIIAESGRFLVARAGVCLSRVLDVKTNGSQRFVILDGGVNVLGGRDLYLGSRLMPLRLLSAGGESGIMTLCGPLCTPTDRIAANLQLAEPRPGDLMAFYLAGAYGPTASAGLFLSHGFPAEVVLANNKLALVRKRTCFEQLLANQRRLNEAVIDEEIS